MDFGLQSLNSISFIWAMHEAHEYDSYLWLQKISRPKGGTFDVVNLWHVQNLLVFSILQNKKRCDTNGRANIRKQNQKVCGRVKNRIRQSFCKHTKRFPRVTVFLYSLFSIYIGVFIGHFEHTKSNQQLILTHYSKFNPNETKRKKTLWMNCYGSNKKTVETNQLILIFVYWIS